MPVNLKFLLEKVKSFFPRNQTADIVIGLDFNHSYLIAIELQKKMDRKLLTRFVYQALDFTPNEMPPNDLGKFSSTWAGNKSLGPAITALMHRAKFSSSIVRIALSGPVVLTRFIQFPKMTLNELKASMQYEIEKYIPFEGSDVIADFHILGEDEQDKKLMKVLLVAAKKTEVFSLIESFHKTNLKMHVIDIHAFACFNAFASTNPELQMGTTLILDIGRETTSLLVLMGKQPAFIREISLGSKDFIETFQKKIGWDRTQKLEFDLPSLVSQNQDSFAESIDSLISQMRLSINYFINNNPKAESPKLIYLSGELCNLPELQLQIGKTLGLEPHLWDCLRGIEIDENVSRKDLESFRPMLPVSLGLALRTG